MQKSAKAAARRWLPRLLLWLFSIAVLLLLAGAAFALVAAYYSGPRLARLVSARASDAIAGQVRITQVRWQLPTSLRIEELAVNDPNGREVLFARTVFVTVRLLPLLERRLELGELRAEAVAVRQTGLVPISKITSSPLVAALSPPPGKSAEKPPSPWSLQIDDVQLLPLTVEVEDAKGAKALSGQLTAATFAYVPAQGLLLADRVRLQLGGATLELAAHFSHANDAAKLAGQLGGSLSVDLARPPANLWADWPKALAQTGTFKVELEGRRAEGEPWLQSDVTLQLSARSLRVAAMPVPTVDVWARLSRGELEISRADADINGGGLSAYGRVVLAGAAAHSYTGVVRLSQFPLRAFADGLTTGAAMFPRQLSGRVSARGELGAQELGQVEAALTVQGPPAQAAKVLPRAIELDVEAAVYRHALQRARIQVRGDGLRAQLTGRVPLAKSSTFDASVQLTHQHPRELLRRFGVPVVAKSARLVARLGGSWAQPQARGSLSVVGVGKPGWPKGRLILPFRLDGDRLQVRAGRFLQENADTPQGDQRGAAAAKGRCVNRRPSLHLQLSEVALAPLTGGLVQGSVSVSLQVTGLGKNLTGEGTVVGSDLSVRGVPVQELTARIRLLPQVVEITDIDLRSGGAHATGSLSYAVQSGAVVGALKVAELDLQDVARVFAEQLPLGGTVDADVQLFGTAAELEVSAHVQGTVSYADTDIGELQAQVERRDGDIGVSAQLAGDKGTLALFGHWRPTTNEIDARLVGHNLDAELLLQRFAPTTGMGGRVDTELSVRGHLPYPQAFGTARITQLTVLGEPLVGTIDLGLNSATEAAGYVVVADMLGVLHAVVHLSPGPPWVVEATAEAEQLQLQRFLPQLARANAGVQLSGRGKVRYQRGVPLAGTVYLRELLATVDGQTLRNRDPVDIELDENGVYVSQLVLESKGVATFELSGRVGKQLDLKAHGELGLSWVAPFVPALAQASGVLQLSLSARGTSLRPDIEGEVKVVHPLLLRPRATAREVQVEAGHVVLRGTSAGLLRVYAQASGQIDGGPVQLEGRMELLRFTPVTYAFTLSGQNLSFRSRTLLFESNARLKVVNRGKQALVQGTVEVVRGRYLRKFQLQELNIIAQEEPVPLPASKAPWLAHILLDVNVQSEAGMEVRVDAGLFSADILLDADVHVGGTAAVPRLEGRLQASRGSIDFPKAQLSVTQAVVDLGPENPAEPVTHLALQAEGEIVPSGAVLVDEPIPPTYLVTLSLTGDLREMSLELTASDPSLNRLQIMALLITGQANLQAVAQLGGGGGAGGASLNAALVFAGSQLTAPLSAFVERQLERVFNLRLQLGAELTTTGVRVTASKALSRRIQLSGAYESTLGGATSLASAQASLLLSDRLVLEGVTEHANVATEELFFRPHSQSRLELRWRLLGY